MSLPEDATPKDVLVLIDVLVGVVGIGLSASWWKISGRGLDKAAIKLFSLIWGGITAFWAIVIVCT